MNILHFKCKTQKMHQWFQRLFLSICSGVTHKCSFLEDLWNSSGLKFMDLWLMNSVTFIGNKTFARCDPRELGIISSNPTGYGYCLLFVGCELWNWFYETPFSTLNFLQQILQRFFCHTKIFLIANGIL